MMNNQDGFLQAILKRDPMMTVRADVHWLRVNQSQDLLYSGAGTTSDTIFGFAEALVSFRTRPVCASRHFPLLR